MATCPLCSEGRRTPQKRHSKVLAVTLIEPEFAVYYCNHCEAQGYCRPDTPSRVIDLAEQQRRRDDFEQHGIEALKIARIERDRMIGRTGIAAS